MIIKILLAIMGAIFALLGIAVIRALMLKPTAAMTATPPESDPERSAEYGRKLSEMIKVETVSSKGETDFSKYRDFQEGLRALFPNVFEKCEIYHPGESLLVRLPACGEAKGEPILLMSHHDVVPAQNEGWKHAPFSGDIDENGAVWGRGTVDTKCSLMCELQALEELIVEGWQPEKDVYIASSCTEEWGGPGAPATVDWLEERNIRLGMLLDEGGMILKDPIAGVNGRYCMVGALEKGSGSVKLVAKDHGGHASAPGRNTALVRLSGLVQDIEKNSPFRCELAPVVREMFVRLAPNSGFLYKLVFSNLWLFEMPLKKILPGMVPVVGAMIKTTCAFTTAGGSEALNVLPTEAYVGANLRFSHHQDAEESLRALEERAAKWNVEVVRLGHSPSDPIVDHTAAPFKLLEEVSARVYPGYDVIPYAMTGGTDAKFYSRVCGHCLRFAPIEINQQQYGSIHTVNENLDSRALPPAVDFYKIIVKEYCSRDNI
ncbi:MAG: M20/M25/M40 family metallo-hydrolase [Clostridia bacterium]|nr:M20/M25/M40 family metallo-hydrolase [Clostridia bacterium]